MMSDTSLLLYGTAAIGAVSRLEAGGVSQPWEFESLRFRHGSAYWRSKPPAKG